MPSPDRRLSLCEVRRRAAVAGLLGLLMALIAPVDSLSRADAREPDWERDLQQQPYRVLFDITVVSDRGVPAAEIANELVVVADRIAGPAFSFVARNLRDEPAAFSSMSARDLLPSKPPEGLSGEADRVVSFAVVKSGSEWRLAQQQWNRETQSLGEPIIGTASEDSRIAAELFRLFARRFQATAVVDRVDEGTITLRRQASWRAAFDPGLNALAPGDFLRPILQFYNRDQKLDRVQEIPWTYLIVTDTKSAAVTCRYVSGLRNPFAAAGRGRVEIMAVAENIPLAVSKVTIERASDPPAPAAWTRVEIVPDVPPGTEPPAGVERLTDRNGRIALTLNAERPLQWIIVHSGSARLARVPFLPGSQAQATLRIPDDDARLRADRELAVLESRLIQAVVLRTATIARTLKAAREGRWDDACRERSLLDELPTASAFTNELGAIRVAGTRLAERAGSPLDKRRIELECRRVQKTIDRFFDKATIRELDDQMVELKRIEAEAAGEEYVPPCPQLAGRPSSR